MTMEEKITGDNWGQLVCVTDTETPPIEINKSKFTIGRAMGMHM